MSSPNVIPPATAPNVTRMLLVKMPADIDARSPAERPRLEPSGGAGPTASLVEGSRAPAVAGVVPGPEAGDQDGHEEQQGGDGQQRRALPHPPPVAVDEEVDAPTPAGRRSP